MTGTKLPVESPVPLAEDPKVNNEEMGHILPIEEEIPANTTWINFKTIILSRSQTQKTKHSTYIIKISVGS